MDISHTVTPNSDQLNADDLMAGPRTFLITEVTGGSDEQPVYIHIADDARTYRPSKSMRRVLIAAWGRESANYVGRMFTLYRDPDVTFGRDKVGGIKISHLSHIDTRLDVLLTATRGKRAPHTVDPLPQVDALRCEWKTADPERRQVIETEVAALTNQKGRP